MPKHPRPSVKLVLGFLSVFVLLSLADLFLTWKLVHTRDGEVLESNPVASWWLATYGWGGMAAFKLGIVLAVGVLAGGIACWRPRTGELLLVFACGAQSAVVLYSVLLPRFLDQQRGDPGADFAWDNGADGSSSPYGPGFLPENGLFLLLTYQAVQEELRLSEAQVKEIVRLVERKQEVGRGYGRPNRDERPAEFRQLLAREKALVDDLGPGQAVRLRQIAWQQRGPFAFADPEVSEALQLTAEQKEAVRALVEGARNARAASYQGRPYGADPARKAEDDRNRAKDQMWAVLTAEQQVRWQEMTGEPFKGDLRPRYGSTFGPGRDPRRFH